MRCLEAEGNRLLIYRRKSIAGSNPAAYDMAEPVRFRPAQITALIARECQEL